MLQPCSTWNWGTLLTVSGVPHALRFCHLQKQWRCMWKRQLTGRWMSVSKPSDRQADSFGFLVAPLLPSTSPCSLFHSLTIFSAPGRWWANTCDTCWVYLSGDHKSNLSSHQLRYRGLFPHPGHWYNLHSCDQGSGLTLTLVQTIQQILFFFFFAPTFNSESLPNMFCFFFFSGEISEEI